MSKWLKQNTAASIIVGPFLATSDGYTSKEAFTSLSGIMYKNSASTVVTPTTATHTASGYYNVALASGSVDTLGRFKLAFANSACHLPVWDDWTILPANTYDSLVSGTDRIDAELAGSGIAASTFAAGAINNAALAACAIGTTTIAGSAIGAPVIPTATARLFADTTLRREWGEAASSADGDTLGFRSLLGAAAKLVNKLDASSGSLQIYKADDTTVLGTQGITACNSSSPIVTLDTT